MKIRDLIKKNEIILVLYDSIRDYCNMTFISDKKYIKKIFLKNHKRELNLENPEEFSDKIQWLKLYWSDPKATQWADKYSARELVEQKIGGKYLNNLIGVYNRVEEINISNLPDSFVLKGTHGSGYNLICKNKNEVDWKVAKKDMRRWLRRNYYQKNREWVYKEIKPRIICEKYMEEENGEKALTDYKFFCFNGDVKYCQVIRGRGENESIDFYDLDWNLMPFTGLRPLPNSKKIFSKPEKYNEMVELAKKLSQGFPFVRVDFYYINQEIKFGELTFFPRSGMGSFYPHQWNKKIGDLIKLPHK